MTLQEQTEALYNRAGQESPALHTILHLVLAHWGSLNRLAKWVTEFSQLPIVPQTGVTPSRPLRQPRGA